MALLWQSVQAWVVGIWIRRLARRHHGEGSGGRVALRAIAGGGMIGILRRGRAVDHGDAEPAQTRLVTTLAIVRDAGVAHRIVRSEGREIRR